MSLTKEGLLKNGELFYERDELGTDHVLRVSLFLGGPADPRVQDTVILMQNQLTANYLRVLTTVSAPSFDALNGTLEYTFSPASITALGADYVFDRVGLWRNTNEVGVWTGDFVSSTYTVTGPFIAPTTTLYTIELQVDDRVFIENAGVLTEYFVETVDDTLKTMTFKDSGGTSVVFPDDTDVNVFDGVGQLAQMNTLAAANTIFQDTSKTFVFLATGQSV